MRRNSFLILTLSIRVSLDSYEFLRVYDDRSVLVMTLCVDLLVFAYFEDASFFLIRCLLLVWLVNDYAINNNIICLVPSSLLGSFCA